MTGNTRLAARGWAVAVGGAAIAFALAGCSTGSADAPLDASPSPTAVQTQPSVQAATAANLLHVCDHVQDAFRSGGLNDADQARGLAAELQGMVDVADPEAARALGPLLKATDAIAADGKALVRPTLQQAQWDASERLRRVCVAAGSQAWG